MKEKFKKWAEDRGINVTETDVPGYTFASTHTEDMWLAYQEGTKQVVTGKKVASNG